MNKIPNVFHFVFGLKLQTEPFHLAYYLCLKTCLEVNKPEKIYFHYKHMPYGDWWEECRPFLTLNHIDESNFIKDFIYENKELEKFRYAHLSDIVRLQVLKEYGGIYADIDTLFVNPVPSFFFQQSFILGKEKVDIQQEAAVKAGGSLCNAWIASEKGAPFCDLWLRQIEAAFDGTWSAHSTFLPYKLSLENPELIHIEPESSFYKYDWTREGLSKIFTDRVTDTQDVYSIHLWSHLWWDVQRNDFSRFNHRKLTCSYIEFGGSTFSELAGKWLPDKFKTRKYTRFLAEKLKFKFLDTKLRLIRKFDEIS